MQAVPKQIAEIELIYKPACRLSDLPRVDCTEDAYTLFAASWNPDKIAFIEQFKVMLLNNARKVLGICEISSGGTRQTIVDVKLVLAAAIKASACNIIIAHNHPGGSLLPGVADMAMTNKLVYASRLMDITLLDHIIITRENFYSFYEHGKLQNERKMNKMNACQLT